MNIQVQKAYLFTSYRKGMCNIYWNGGFSYSTLSWENENYMTGVNLCTLRQIFFLVQIALELPEKINKLFLKFYEAFIYIWLIMKKKIAYQWLLI